MTYNVNYTRSFSSVMFLDIESAAPYPFYDYDRRDHDEQSNVTTDNTVKEFVSDMNSRIRTVLPEHSLYTTRVWFSIEPNNLRSQFRLSMLAAREAFQPNAVKEQLVGSFGFLYSTGTSVYPNTVLNSRIGDDFISEIIIDCKVDANLVPEEIRNIYLERMIADAPILTEIHSYRNPIIDYAMKVLRNGHQSIRNIALDFIKSPPETMAARIQSFKLAVRDETRRIQYLNFNNLNKKKSSIRKFQHL